MQSPSDSFTIGTRVPDVSGRQGLRRLWPYIGKHRHRLALGLALIPLFLACQLALPRQLSAAVGLLVRRGPEAPFDAAEWNARLVVIALLGVGYAFLRFVSRWQIMGLSRRAEEDLKADLFHHLQRLPQDFHDRARIGDLISRINQDVELLRFQTGPTLFFGASVLILFPTVMFFLFRLSPELGFAMLAFFVVGVLLMLRVFGRIEDASRQVQEALGVIGAKAQEDFSGVRVLQAFARERAEVEAFTRVSDVGMDKQIALARMRGRLESLFYAAGSIGLLAVISVGVWVGLGVEQLFEAILYLQMLVWPLMILGWILQTYHRAAAAVKRLDEVFEIPVETEGGAVLLGGGEQDPGGSAPAVPVVESVFTRERPTFRPEGMAEADTPAIVHLLGAGDGRSPSLEARSLTFRYPGPPPQAEPGDEHERAKASPTLAELRGRPPGPIALVDVSFRLAPNQTLGLVGPVGAGKSTLISLLTRLYEPPRGTLFVDGVDVRDQSIELLRKRIAVAPQEPFLFGRSIRDNVLFAHDEGLDDGEDLVEAALEASRLAPDIERIPGGLDELVGERGIKLSGGQKQRASLARALAGRRPLLILDDTLSAVDHETEKGILGTLRALVGRQTTIVIAHRLEAVRDADLILVLDRGRVLERGTHAELLALEGWYAQTWVQQQEERGA